MDYQEAVKLGKRLSKKTTTDQWRWADLVDAAFPKGTHHIREKLSEFIADTGCPYSVSTLYAFRETARGWPEDKRVEGVAFSVHQETRYRSDRFNEVTPDTLLKDVRDLSPFDDGFKERRKKPRHEQAPQHLMKGAISNLELAARRLREWEVPEEGVEACRDMRADLELAVEELEESLRELR